MSFLSLNEYQALSPLEPESPSIPKKAIVAFLLSLVLPGIGQVYAKRETAGWVTFAFFALSFLAAIASLFAGKVEAAGTLIYFVISLYIFSFLDAYFAALEYNQGISSYLIGGNPRIACILNFFTNGIGYFYLGDRGKGLVIFVGLAILRQVLLRVTGNNSWVSYLWIILQIAMAFDAYRVARKRLLESFPQLANYSWRAATNGQLSPAVPISLAIMLVLPAIGLLILGGFAYKATGIHISAGDVQSTPEGIQYTNKNLELKLTLPDGWQITQSVGDTMIRAHKIEQDGDGQCEIILLRQFSWSSPESFQKDMERQLARKPGFSVYGHANGTLGNLPATRMQVGVGTQLAEQITTAKIGMTIYTLIGVNKNDDDCSGQLDRIKNSFSAKR